MGLRYHQVKHVFLGVGTKKFPKEYSKIWVEHVGSDIFLWKIRWTSPGKRTRWTWFIGTWGVNTAPGQKKTSWNPAWIGWRKYADTIHLETAWCLCWKHVFQATRLTYFNITFLHYRSLGGLHAWHMSRCQIFDPENWPAEGNSRPATCEGWRRTCSTGWRGVIAKQYPLQSHLRTSHKRYTRNTTFLYMLDFKMMFLGDLRFLQYLGVSNE